MAETLFLVDRRAKKSHNWLYKIFLVLSFVVANLYNAVCLAGQNHYSSYGLYFAYSSNFTEEFAFSLIALTLVYWAVFELFLFLYKNALTFSVYGYVVPVTKMKNSARVFYAIKNILYGVFAGLCLIAPYLYEILGLIEIILFLGLLVAYSFYLQKKFSSPLISHFVFKTFCYPVFIYEIIIMLLSLLGVL